jgi:molybdenum cofactor cytidylyltransferase
VTGHEAQQVRSVVDIPRVEFAHNSHYESGEMLSSVKTGCLAIRQRCDWFFLVLGDQPLVQSSTYRHLLDTKRTDQSAEARIRMVQPTFQSRRGHPILLASDCIDEILTLPADATLKTFTQRIQPRLVEVDDPGVVSDIDTPEDYDRALAQLQAHRSESCNSKV